VSTTWTIADAIKSQLELTKTLGAPHFAPQNGVCWACHRQIYEAPNGLDGKSYVTGCPWCFRSYCD
jgi:hypothetical protein